MKGHTELESLILMNCSLNTQCSYLCLHQHHEAGKHCTFLVGRAGINRNDRLGMCLFHNCFQSTFTLGQQKQTKQLFKGMLQILLDKQYQNFTKNYGDGQYIWWIHNYSLRKKNKFNWKTSAPIKLCNDEHAQKLITDPQNCSLTCKICDRTLWKWVLWSIPN